MLQEVIRKKYEAPARRRELAQLMHDRYQVSCRRVCALAAICPNTWYYKPQARDTSALADAVVQPRASPTRSRHCPSVGHFPRPSRQSRNRIHVEGARRMGLSARRRPRVHSARNARRKGRQASTPNNVRSPRRKWPRSNSIPSGNGGNVNRSRFVVKRLTKRRDGTGPLVVDESQTTVEDGCDRQGVILVRTPRRMRRCSSSQSCRGDRSTAIVTSRVGDTPQ
jgi:hypothetical protein